MAPICELLGVSRSGYYASRQRLQKPRQISAVETQVVATFMVSGRSYGSRRVRAALAVQGTMAGRYRVRTLMREQGLRPVWRRQCVHTTDSKHDLPVAAHVLNRQFDPVETHKAWVADLTYLRTRSGWLYLAAVMDLFSSSLSDLGPRRVPPQPFRGHLLRNRDIISIK